MTERKSERIWAAARAAYESRRAVWDAVLPRPTWDALNQDHRDIEYDAMRAALDVWVGPPWSVDDYKRVEALEARIAELEADKERLLRMCDLNVIETREAERLRAEVRRLQNSEVNDCDLLGVHERRIAELEAYAGRFADRVRELYTALKPFAEYAERIEQRCPGWYHEEFIIVVSRTPDADLVNLSMAWFIAALKAYRREAVAGDRVSELAEELLTLGWKVIPAAMYDEVIAPMVGM